MYRFTRILFANYKRFGSLRSQVDFTPKFPEVTPPVKLILGSSLLAFFQNKKEENEKEEESDLIMTIKRGNYLV